MNHGSLFSGIGGFDLAAEWMGWKNLFNCEWEQFPRKVLKYHFPNAQQYGDIKEFNATDYAGRIDILTGGFPCQPYSVAGKRLGKEDERHLWPEMLRVIRECSPRWVVGENVRGLVNWNGGLVFEEVCADLEACGYSVQPFVLPACAVNAPHRRDRVWFVAADTSSELLKRNESGKRRAKGEQNLQQENGATNPKQSRTMGKDGNASDTDGERLLRNRPSKCGEKSKRRNPTERGNNRKQIGAGYTDYPTSNKWKDFPTVPPVCGGDDGLPQELDGITFPKWRRESIKAYGNAIVPQVAYEIFQAIKNYENDQP